MARIYPLYSSSSGNCTYIGSKNEGILIDCGVSFSKLKSALSINEIDISAVKAVFISHEHHDHTAGLRMLTKKTGVPVFAQSYTLDILYDEGMINSSAEDMKGIAEAAGFRVSCFRTSHDTKESCGYVIEADEGKKCAVCTDLGFVSEEVRQALNGCKAVVLESNYDEDMLRTGHYPSYLKARIRSDIGHLSNKQCGEFAAELISSGTEHLILGHLSHDNNSPDRAEYTVESIIAEHGFQRGRDYLLQCAPSETKGGYVSF